MGGSLLIGRIAGIRLYLHWTFGLLLAGAFAFYLVQGAPPTEALAGVGLILAVFGCVVLHELGHALMARRFDVPTRDITLYPIGGVARLQRIPEQPSRELLIALAGPAVNVLLAGGFVVLILLANRPLLPGPEGLLAPGEHFLANLLWVNVVLVAFNLLPAFPMDGGRVLRALLALRMDYVRATQIAAGVGQGMAILFALWSVFFQFNPFLLFIALFVYLGAQQEAHATALRSALQGIPVSQAMITRFQTLGPEQTLGDAVQELLAGHEDNFPIVRDGALVGVLTRKRLLRALSEHGRTARVGDVAEPCAPVEASAMLDEAFRLMQQAECGVLPVTRGGRLVGVLTKENVGELMMVSTALKGSF